MDPYLKNEKEMRGNLQLLLHGCLYGFLLALAMEGKMVSARTPKAVVPEYCAEDPDAPLIPALGRNQLPHLKKILRERADPNECFSGMSPLMWAIDANNPETIRQLLDAGAHPDRPLSDDKGMTPLAFSLSNRFYDIATLLLSRGANPRHVTELTGQNILHQLPFGSGKGEDPPLELEIAQISLKAGVKLDSRDINGATPLILAAAVGDQPLISWLLYQGADDTLKDNQNRDALSRARKMRRSSTEGNREKNQIILLLETEPQARLLRQGKTADFERAFKNCAPEKTARHATALLMTAVEYGQREAARTLIRCGGKADETGFVLHRLAEKDRFGEPKLAAARMTPLALATLKGDEAMTVVLKQAQ